MLHIYKKRGASPVTRSTVERPSHCPDCRNRKKLYDALAAEAAFEGFEPKKAEYDAFELP